MDGTNDPHSCDACGPKLGKDIKACNVCLKRKHSHEDEKFRSEPFRGKTHVKDKLRWMEDSLLKVSKSFILDGDTSRADIFPAMQYDYRTKMGEKPLIVILSVSQLDKLKFWAQDDDFFVRMQKQEETYTALLGDYMQELALHVNRHEETIDEKTTELYLSKWSEFVMQEKHSDCLSVLVREHDYIGSDTSCLVANIFKSGIIMLAISEGILPNANNFGIAFGQAMRAVALLGLEPPKVVHFHAIMFFLYVNGRFGLTQQFSFLFWIAKTIAVRLKLNQKETYAGMRSSLARRVETVFWLLYATARANHLLTGKFPFLTASEASTPIPVWPESSDLCGLTYLFGLEQISDRVQRYFIDIRSSPKSRDNAALGATTLNVELEKWYEELPASLKENQDSANIFISWTCSTIQEYYVLKCVASWELAFTYMDETAARTCIKAAKGILDVALTRTGKTKRYAAFQSMLVDFAHTVLCFYMCLYPHDPQNWSLLEEISKNTPRFRKFALPSLARSLEERWDIAYNWVKKALENQPKSTQ